MHAYIPKWGQIIVLHERLVFYMRYYQFANYNQNHSKYNYLGSKWLAAVYPYLLSTGSPYHLKKSLIWDLEYFKNSRFLYIKDVKSLV